MKRSFSARARVGWCRGVCDGGLKVRRCRSVKCSVVMVMGVGDEVVGMRRYRCGPLHATTEISLRCGGLTRQQVGDLSPVGQSALLPGLCRAWHLDAYA